MLLIKATITKATIFCQVEYCCLALKSTLFSISLNNKAFKNTLFSITLNNKAFKMDIKSQKKTSKRRQKTTLKNNFEENDFKYF